MARQPIDPLLWALINSTQPAASAAGYFYPLPGLGGLSGKVVCGEQQWLARRQPESPFPAVSRQREQRILRRLSGTGLAPAVLGYNRQWLLLEWLPGEAERAGTLAAHNEALVTLLTHLHHQPLCGYRLQLLPLLYAYWQRCRQRHPRWLRRLRQLRRQGEPRPLRMALLHMDIHAGNILGSPQGLHLIDWEYAADGDVALELAAIISGNNFTACQQQQLLTQYARINQLDIVSLQRQVIRWQPWLRLLTASWFQLRQEQSGDAVLQQLACLAWQAV